MPNLPTKKRILINFRLTYADDNVNDPRIFTMPRFSAGAGAPSLP